MKASLTDLPAEVIARILQLGVFDSTMLRTLCLVDPVFLSEVRRLLYSNVRISGDAFRRFAASLGAPVRGGKTGSPVRSLEWQHAPQGLLVPDVTLCLRHCQSLSISISLPVPERSTSFTELKLDSQTVVDFLVVGFPNLSVLSLKNLVTCGTIGGGAVLDRLRTLILGWEPCEFEEADRQHVVMVLGSLARVSPAFTELNINCYDHLSSELSALQAFGPALRRLCISCDFLTPEAFNGSHCSLGVMLPNIEHLNVHCRAPLDPRLLATSLPRLAELRFDLVVSLEPSGHFSSTSGSERSMVQLAQAGAFGQLPSLKCASLFFSFDDGSKPSCDKLAEDDLQQDDDSDPDKWSFRGFAALMSWKRQSQVQLYLQGERF